MEIKQKLIDEFNSRMDELSEMDLTDENFETSVNSVTKLADRIIKINESEESVKEKESNRKLEEHLEKLKIEANQKEKETNREFEEKLEMMKLESEQKEKELNRQLEEKLETQKIEDDKKSKLISHAITIGSTLLTIGVSIYAYKSNMRYESEGIVPTTEGGRNSLRNLFKLKF